MLMRRGMGRGGRPGLLGMAARTAVVAGTATAVAGGVSRHQQGKAEEQAQAQAYQQEQAAAAAAPAPAPVAAPAEGMDDKIAQIKKLAELHDQGILTDDEFAAQKAKLLG
jgi:hypothetical protein